MQYVPSFSAKTHPSYTMAAFLFHNIVDLIATYFWCAISDELCIRHERWRSCLLQVQFNEWLTYIIFMMKQFILHLLCYAITICLTSTPYEIIVLVHGCHTMSICSPSYPKIPAEPINHQRPHTNHRVYTRAVCRFAHGIRVIPSV